MKRIEKYLLNSCALTVLVLSLIYIFAIISSPEITPAVQIGRYFTILLFSFLTVGASYLFSVPKIPKLLVFAIHYLVVLIAFMLIFIDLKEITAPKAFISVAIFTIFYTLLFAIVIGIKKLCSRLDKLIKKKTREAPKKEAYKPRYK